MIDLLIGDCFDYMKTIPDKSVDIILTDPPYGKHYHNGASRGKKGFGAARHVKYSSSINWDDHIPSKFVFSEMFRIAKNLIIFGGNYFAHLLPPSNCWLFWDKKGDVPFQNPFADGELIYTTFKRPVKRIVFKQQGFISDSHDERYHPTQKPTELLQLLLEEFTEAGETVLDPFMGSGSTGVACVNTGRNFIGMELDPGYFETAKKRIDEAQIAAEFRAAQLRIGGFYE